MKSETAVYILVHRYRPYTRDLRYWIRSRTHITSSYHNLECKLPWKLIKPIKDRQISNCKSSVSKLQPRGGMKVKTKHISSQLECTGSSDYQTTNASIPSPTRASCYGYERCKSVELTAIHVLAASKQARMPSS